MAPKGALTMRTDAEREPDDLTPDDDTCADCGGRVRPGDRRRLDPEGVYAWTAFLYPRQCLGCAEAGVLEPLRWEFLRPRSDLALPACPPGDRGLLGLAADSLLAEPSPGGEPVWRVYRLYMVLEAVVASLRGPGGSVPLPAGRALARVFGTNWCPEVVRRCWNRFSPVALARLRADLDATEAVLEAPGREVGRALLGLARAAVEQLAAAPDTARAADHAPGAFRADDDFPF
jgi:hypothetical protein